MSDSVDLRSYAYAWAMFTLLFYSTALALAWSGQGEWARRLRWPVTVLTLLSLISLVVLFASAKR